MKLSTWILVGLLLAGAVGGFVAWRRATEPARAWAEFLELEGEDVRALSDDRQARAHALFQRFAPFSAPGRLNAFIGAWALLRVIPGKGEPWWIALRSRIPAGQQQVYPVAVGVGAAGGSAPLLPWLLGPWETLPETARVASGPDAGSWLLEFGFEGPDPARWYYAPADDERLHLLRVEDGWKTLRTDFLGVLPESLKGEYPRFSDAEWLPALRDARVVSRLWALNRLGQRDSKGRPLWERPLGRTEIRDILETMRTSPNPWIREAAELALRP